MEYQMRLVKRSLAGFLLSVFTLFCFLTASAVPYSPGPRSVGVEIIEEVVQGPKAFIIRVGSNGCTTKNSLAVSIKKEAGVSERAPHYVLTINRKVPDECKAIVEEGAVIIYDLQKDLGIAGNYTYSISNPVASAHLFRSHDDSFFSLVMKQAAPPLPETRTVSPLPYEQYAMTHEYFTCLVPSDWQRGHLEPSGEKDGIYEIRLTKSGKARPEEGDKYFYPDPVIYVGYYAPGNSQGKTYEGFIADYEKLMEKNAGNPKKYDYRRPEKSRVGSSDATITAYEIYQETPRGPLFSIKYWIKARFVVIKARQGFYVVAFRSPKEFYDQYLPVFQTVLDSFKPLY